MHRFTSLTSTLRTRAGVGVGVALSAIVISTAAVAATPSAHVTPSRFTASTGGDAPKPTVVFVHGAWADSSGWNSTVSSLGARGYQVVAASVPLRGLASDSDYVSSLISSISGPVILVGHSYGGAVISNAAVGRDNVKALVYVAGWVPDDGESLGFLASKNPGSLITPDNLVFRPYSEGSRGQGTDTFISQEVFRDAFAGDVPEDQAAVMQATQRPLAAEIFGEPSGPTAWETVDSYYLLTTRDRAIPPATQRFMAERAGAKITEIDASHVPMISRPRVVTRLVLDAIRSVS